MAKPWGQGPPEPGSYDSPAGALPRGRDQCHGFTPRREGEVVDVDTWTCPPRPPGEAPDRRR